MSLDPLNPRPDQKQTPEKPWWIVLDLLFFGHTFGCYCDRGKGWYIYIYIHIHRYISVFHGLTPFLQHTYRFLRWILTSDFMGELPTTQRALKGVVGYQWNHTVWHRAQVNRISVATRLACNVHNMGACLYVGGRSLKTGSSCWWKKKAWLG